MIKKIRKNLSARNLLEWQLNRPLIVIGGLLLMTALFALAVPKLSFKTSIYDLVIEDLPETARYEAFKAVFGSDEIIRVVVRADNVFDNATFTEIQALSDEAARIKGVRRVISLPLIKQAVDLSGNWDLAKFRDVLSHVDLFKKNLFSADGKSTVLTLVLTTDADPDAVIAAVHHMIDEAPHTLSLYQIGMPLVSQALAFLTQKDFFRLPPITFLLIAVILLFIYKNVLHLMLPLLCVSFALIWDFGLMAVFGIKLSILTMIVPVFLIAVGTAYCLHIVAEYLLQAQQAETPKDAARAAFMHVTFPTVLAVITTLVGLGSLLINRITAIREFAIFACLGILSLLIVAVTLFPAVMTLMPLPKKRSKQSGPQRRIVERFIDRIADLNLNHQMLIYCTLGAVVIFCIVGMFRIHVESNPVGYFKKDTDISRNFHDIYRDLSGAFPINVTMSGPEPDFFEDAQRIGDIAKFQKFLGTLPGIDKSISFADYMMLVNYASNRFEPPYYKLPEESWEVRMLINSYRTMLGEDMLTRFMSPDFSKANLLILTHISSSRDFLNIRQKILTYVRENFSKDITWEVTGFGMVISESSQQLTSGQVKSLSITMVIVFGIMLLLFLSSKVGLISIVPNLFPIVVNFGLMGWFGVELSMFTSLIASIAIGLAVDDTIHYLVRYNREFRKDLNERRALRETLRDIGRPIIFTTLTISIGFSVLTLSSFKPTAIFGTMMAVTMISALVGDLVLLPSLMLHVELVTLWDLVRLKLGKDPGFGIPLFNGLSRTQIHYIIMAGTLKKIDAGEVLFHKGAASDSMCAIISGAMDVVELEKEAGSMKDMAVYKQLNRAKAGDILGEMGLLRNMPRSATVIATEPSEYLEINLKMIRRLQWLYPPTANRFFMNLMTILCNRIERVTQSFACESITDDLTGWYNRKGFAGVLETEMNRAGRYGEPLSLCLMGITLEVADLQMSYEIKDRNLRLIGSTLSRLIRKCDALGRLDAETFALLMPETSQSQAEPVCNRLKNLLLAKRLDVDGLRMHVDLTIVAVNCEAGMSASDLLLQAEKDFSAVKRPA